MVLVVHFMLDQRGGKPLGSVWSAGARDCPDEIIYFRAGGLFCPVTFIPEKTRINYCVNGSSMGFC
jgi:hypothetical protein